MLPDTNRTLFSEMNLKIGLMKNDEADQVSKLIRVVFEEFVAPDFSTEGIETFISYIKPEAIVQRAKDEKHFAITAQDQERMIGIIEVRGNNHISLLFVDKTYHGRGIAKKLYEAALKHCRESKPDINEFEVNASRYAVPIYERLGFKKIDEEQFQNGFLFTPMKANLQ